MEPLKFLPLLKSLIWGGNKLIPFKRLDIQQPNVGECWEVSGVPGCESVVAEGEFQGQTLNQVVAKMKGKLLGQDNYQRFGDEFPLLVKFIDARDQLSIQVHPNDEIAKKYGLPHGKTEMWYALPSDPTAKLRCGWSKSITPERYGQMVEDGSIVDAIAEYTVKEGDCFFLPAGRIHSIGAGCFLAEIQQTSDVTYRIYDFHRKDAEGRERELHTKQAAECIDYRVERDYRTHYTPQMNQGVGLVSCPHFQVAVYDLDEPMTLDYSLLDSFVILVCVKGQGTLTDNEGHQVSLRMGETLLYPATTEVLRVEGTVKFLEAYV